MQMCHSARSGLCIHGSSVIPAGIEGNSSMEFSLPKGGPLPNSPGARESVQLADGGESTALELGEPQSERNLLVTICNTQALS